MLERARMRSLSVLAPDDHALSESLVAISNAFKDCRVEILCSAREAQLEHLTRRMLFDELSW